MAGALQLLARAAGKQSRRAAAALAPHPHAATTPLQRAPIAAAAMLAAPRASTASRVLAAPKLQRLLLPAGSDHHVLRVPVRARDIAAGGDAPEPNRSLLARAVPTATGAKGAEFPFADGARAEGGARGGTLPVVVDVDSAHAALNLYGGATGAKGAGFPFADGARGCTLPVVVDVDSAHAALNLYGGATGAKGAGFPFADGARGCTLPVVVNVDSAHAALNLYGGVMMRAEGVGLHGDSGGGAVVCVGDAALGPHGAAFLAPPLAAAAVILYAFRVRLPPPTIPRLFVAPLLPAGSNGLEGTKAKNNAQVGAKESTAVAGAVPNGSRFALTIPTTTGAEAAGFPIAMAYRYAHQPGAAEAAGRFTFPVLVGVDSAHAALSLNGGAVLCVQDDATGSHGAAFPAPLLERRPVAAAAAAVIFTASASRVIGRRAYSTAAGGTGDDDASKKCTCGRDDDSFKPRVHAQTKVISKLARLHSIMRCIESSVLLHAKSSHLLRRELDVKGRKLKYQIRFLPLWFFGALLLGIAFAFYLVVEVVVPRVAQVAADEFIKLATQLKDMANEVDEEKIKRMASDLTMVITNTMMDCIGGRVKGSIQESLKFWKWGKKKT